MKSSFLLIIILLTLISACGGGKSSSGAPTAQQQTTPVVIPTEANPDSIDIDATIDGQYLAVFETVNPIVTGKITGAFTFSRDTEIDELVGDVRITNAGPGVLHAQNLRVGGRCPTLQDDTNADGYIDAKEAEAVYGRVLFPLDGDISSQSSHDGEYPVGDTYGNYIYARATSFSQFISDLRAIDSGDGYFRLGSRDPLDLENRVVVVHGVDAAAALPTTVGSVGRFVNHQSLPIACGVLRKVLTPPGEVDTGTYPQGEI